MTREDAVALVKKFDGEFPDKYFSEIMEYLGIDPDYFRNELTDRFRSPHLWIKDGNDWKLRHNVCKSGYNDNK